MYYTNFLILSLKFHVINLQQSRFPMEPEARRQDAMTSPEPQCGHQLFRDHNTEQLLLTIVGINISVWKLYQRVC